MYRHDVYGISLRSEFQLALPEGTGDGFARIEVRRGTSEQFERAIVGTALTSRADWYQFAHLGDGSSYVRWHGLGEFLVSAAGDRIYCVHAPEASQESFQVYLLGQAFSFALVKSGFEPLHGTAVECDGDAVAFLGESGFGKSTLAASAIAGGCRLVTDDCLLLRAGDAGVDAYPGPPRIKLFPDAARRFLRTAATGVPINATTNKHVIPLGPKGQCPAPVRLRAIYVLGSPTEMRRRRKIRIEPLTAREAYFALVENTYNRYITDSERLRRQLAAITRIVRVVPVRRLWYPRSLARLAEVRDAVLADGGVRCRGAA